MLAAAHKGPLTDLAIPPLPIAILEEHRRLAKRRPLCPADIHTPFDQAVSSPWSVWMSDHVQIPPETVLGDPSTFWWMSPDEQRKHKHSVYQDMMRKWC